MIIDIVSIWIGRILLFSVAILLLVWTWYEIINKIQFTDVYFKGLIFHFLSNKKFVKDQGIKNKIDLRLGRKWITKYKDNEITWEIVKIKGWNKK